MNNRYKQNSEIHSWFKDFEKNPSDEKINELLNIIEKYKSAAKLLGKQGGLIGGKKRAESLSSKRRSEIARNAANKRWSSK